ncbi:hypothetical protein V7S43_010042 [Phytophthora oleae]|uniref:Uncharacterized protein n=1 Tax=Phytophthora oleae TaxID=2107226 RepID=A0ABD3FIR4_9STRA
MQRGGHSARALQQRLRTLMKTWGADIRASLRASSRQYGDHAVVPPRWCGSCEQVLPHHRDNNGQLQSRLDNNDVQAQLLQRDHHLQMLGLRRDNNVHPQDFRRPSNVDRRGHQHVQLHSF